MGRLPETSSLLNVWFHSSFIAQTQSQTFSLFSHFNYFLGFAFYRICIIMIWYKPNSVTCCLAQRVDDIISFPLPSNATMNYFFKIFFFTPVAPLQSIGHFCYFFFLKMLSNVLIGLRVNTKYKTITCTGVLYWKTDDNSWMRNWLSIALFYLYQNSKVRSNL